MFSYIWHTIFFDPVYNGLVFFIDVVPGGDAGLAIITLTIVVKFLLLPLSIKATRTQFLMQQMEPKLKEIKEKYGKNREELGRATMKAYSDAGVNPLAGVFLLFIQIPILFALYFSFYSGGGVKLPDINTALLYSFIQVPLVVNMLFLGIVDVAAKSAPLALLAGVTQFFQVRLSMAPLPARDLNAAPSFKDDFARSMQLQMRYVMPVIILVVAYQVNAALALYFVVSNLFSIVQETFIKKSITPPKE